jgi:hypothetical protein
MRQRLPTLAALAALCLSTSAFAQVQAGAHYSALSLEYPDQTRSGFGGFFVYSPRPWIGADVATTVFLDEDVGGHAWQFLAGPRVGVAVQGLGVYGRVRPGLIHFSERFFQEAIACVLIFPPPESCLVKSTNLALDLGATVEAPISAAVLRFDIGDTMTRYRRLDEKVWRHGLQFVAGIGWKF